MRKIDETHIVLFLVAAILVFFTKDFPFYWDNVVQLSLPANWYYDNNFSSWLLPEGYGSGHPPFIAAYFGILWKIFGRTLLVSHLAMFPFVFGLLFQLYQLLKNLGIIQKKLVYLILAFLILDATILSQLSLITFDVIQLFFLFLCYNAILKKRKLLLTIAFLLLLFVSLRGAIAGAGVIAFQFLYHRFYIKRIYWRDYIYYLPGIIALGSFFLIFYMERGWIAYDQSGSYAQHSQFASLKEMFKNVLVFAWRLGDFGRIVIMLIAGILILQCRRLKLNTASPSRVLMIIILSQLAVFMMVTIPFQNPFGHRYLMPLIIPLIIFAVYGCYLCFKSAWLWLGISFVCLVSGHFWLYPETISQGWDATTLHWNYLQVSEKMKGFVEDSEITHDSIGAFFPSYRSFKYSHLEESSSGYHVANTKTDDFIILSNAFNISDEVLAELKNEEVWETIQEFERNRIFIRLLQKKK